MAVKTVVSEATFSAFSDVIARHVARMVDDGTSLFVADVDPQKMWETYLGSFAPGTDPMYRVRTEHDCSACRSFVKKFGGVVTIKEGVVTTIWDSAAVQGTRYEPVVRALDEYVRSRPIRGVAAIDSAVLGHAPDLEMIGDVVHAWVHLQAKVPERLVNCTRQTADTVRGTARDLCAGFVRSLEEISQNAVGAVLELIAQNSLYRGEEWRPALEKFRAHQEAYMRLGPEARTLYAWEHAGKAGVVVAKLRNHSMGTILMDLTGGMDLAEAVRRYEAIMAPSTYKRPTAIFSANSLKSAEKVVTELGYLDSLPRRFATLSDITVADILFVDRDVRHRLAGEGVFGQMARDVPQRPKNFDHVEEVPLQTFLSEVLPTAQKIEVLVEPRHSGNLVSLIAPQKRDAPSMFKWANGFSWAYTGNVADAMKARVKALGGQVEGALRFSIMWNVDRRTDDDLDAHCTEPGGAEISFRRKMSPQSRGMLDVDIIHPSRQSPGGHAVENIIWPYQDRLLEGMYQMSVHCFSSRGGASGFSAEVEFDDVVHRFAHPAPLRQKEVVHVAEVTYRREHGFSIVGKLPTEDLQTELWGVRSGTFQPVEVVMYSPNHWAGEAGIGNRHVFFMLAGMKNPDTPNGFYNEFLENSLVPHRKVFESLGSRMRVAPSDEQLSGLGFSTTQRNTLVVRVTGHTQRVLKVII